MFKPGDMVNPTGKSLGFNGLEKYEWPCQVVHMYNRDGIEMVQFLSNNFYSKHGDKVLRDWRAEYLELHVPTKRLIGNTMILANRNRSTRMITPTGRVYWWDTDLKRWSKTEMPANTVLRNAAQENQRVIHGKFVFEVNK